MRFARLVPRRRTPASEIEFICARENSLHLSVRTPYRDPRALWSCGKILQTLRSPALRYAPIGRRSVALLIADDDKTDLRDNRTAIDRGQRLGTHEALNRALHLVCLRDINRYNILPRFPNGRPDGCLKLQLLSARHPLPWNYCTDFINEMKPSYIQCKLSHSLQTAFQS